MYMRSKWPDLTIMILSEVAVGGDVVDYTRRLQYRGNIIPSLRWTALSSNKYNRIDPGESAESTVIQSIRVQVSDGPATVSPSCHVTNTDSSWPAGYFWQSTAISVSCQYKVHSISFCLTDFLTAYHLRLWYLFC